MGFKIRLLALVLTFFAATAVFAQLKNEECLACHDGGGAPAVDAKKFGASIHAPLACNDCHADVKAYPHEPKPANAKAACAGCHSDADSAWANGIHGKAAAAGVKKAATCLGCHGSPHEILPSSDPNSRTFHRNLAGTCATCHAQKFVMNSVGLTTTPLVSFEQSVHGKALAAGNIKAADCVDCHSHHEILPANDPRSKIFKFNVPKTCGQCHPKIAQEYTASIHGQSLARGNWQAAVCTDCHGIHNIKKHSDPTSSVAAANIANTACGQCHGNVRLTREFGISPDRVKSYQASYHGLAKRRGSTEAANCASCHGVHNIFPASDPRSTINKANLPKTCGKCHEGAGTKFAAGRVHLEAQLTATETSDKAVKYVALFYIPVIGFTLGGMALHNVVILQHKAREKRKQRKRTRAVVRMNRIQRIQHAFLVTSFFLLVITGFALAFPDAWWASITGPEAVRRVIHRVSAIVMLILGVYHVGYMCFTKEGRQGLKDFWFQLKDLRDVIGVMKYNLGITHEHPKMGRFTYAEKAEYWALVWGTIVMGVTGLMMWFNVEVTRALSLPRWLIDVATSVHWYEAILATAAIIIWHLYSVIFDPDIYPLNWTFFDGKIPEEQYKHEHELSYEQLKRDGKIIDGKEEK